MQQGPLRAGREPEGESLQHLQKGMTASLYGSLRNTRTSSRNITQRERFLMLKGQKQL